MSDGERPCRFGYTEYDGARYCHEHGDFLEPGVQSLRCGTARRAALSGDAAPADTAHLLRPGGSRLPNGGGWSCTGCGWVFSYNVALARAQEVWAADQRHQPT